LKEASSQAACGEVLVSRMEPFAIGNESEKPRPKKLSEELHGLVEAFAERAVTLRDVIGVLKGRAYTLLLILLALPFCTPIPLPGLSTLFGMIIALIGFRLSLRLNPWLPARLLDAYLPPRFFQKLLRATLRILRGIEYFLRPRWSYLVDTRPLHHLYGAVICMCGLFLLLPLPVPFSNLFPALTVVFLASAILERDGFFVLAGGLMFVFTLAFFGGLAWGGLETFDFLRRIV
jgi:hypothetical protein